MWVAIDQPAISRDACPRRRRATAKPRRTSSSSRSSVTAQRRLKRLSSHRVIRIESCAHRLVFATVTIQARKLVRRRRVSGCCFGEFVQVAPERPAGLR
jgi:hypothetical protein